MAIKKPCFDYQAATKDKDRNYDLTPAERRPIYDYMRKKYLDNGVTLEEAINGMVKETSKPGGQQIPARFFAEVVTGPKSAKGKTTEQYITEDARRRAQYDAEQVIERADHSGLMKVGKMMMRIPRAILTPFHSGVFPVTHGGELLMHPTQWKIFWDGELATWKSLSENAYENIRKDIYTHSRYALYRSNGLRVGVDERAQGLMSGWLASSPGWNQRAWIGLIKMRMDLMDQLVAKEHWKTPDELADIVKELAPIVNHSTGVVGSAPWGAFSRAWFSPQLTASKLARGFVDPVKMVGLSMKWMHGTASIGEKAFVRREMYKIGGYIGTRMSLLYLNDAILQGAGSDQRINFGHPGHTQDWLRAKSGTGLVFADRALEDVLRVYGALAATTWSVARDRHGKGVFDADIDVIKQYMTYKLDPSIETYGELLVGEDIFGRPIPKAFQLGRALGIPEKVGTAKKTQYTIPEYLWAHSALFLNGPAADIYEGMQQNGLSEPDAKILTNGALALFLHSAGWGTRYEFKDKPIGPTRQKKFKGAM